MGIDNICKFAAISNSDVQQPVVSYKHKNKIGW